MGPLVSLGKKKQRYYLITNVEPKTERTKVWRSFLIPCSNFLLIGLFSYLLQKYV